ncbi:MAG TPA: hypothetical protein VFS00_18115, partial [Polyangiaceae bacterium]|nr:hypothetical protein [Polyangiaceae bacterium]
MKGHSVVAPSLAVALAGALALAPADVRAEPAAGADRAVAEALDAEGTALLDQRRYDEACERFGESYRLLPGNGVLLRLGLCQELQGKTASAWLTFRDAAARARASGDAQSERLAARRAAAIEPRLSRLTVRLDSDAGAEPVRVTRDGVSLGRAAFGAPLPIDPGTHVIEAVGPAGQRFAQTVVVGAGGAETVTVTFADTRAGQAAAARAGEPTSAPPADQATGAPAAPPSIVAPPSPAPPAAASEAAARKKVAPAADPAPGRPAPGSAQKTAALAVGGLGLAGLGAGVAFQLAVFENRDRAASLCPTRRDCSPDAIAARD